MLRVSEFTLLSTFISDFHLVANPDFNNELQDKTTYNSSADCNKNQDGLYIVRLSVTSELADKSNWAYQYDIQAFAYLKLLDDKLSDNDQRLEALAYGVQVLFGALREHLHIMTWRGPWKNFPINLELCDISHYLENAKAAWSQE